MSKNIRNFIVRYKVDAIVILCLIVCIFIYFRYILDFSYQHLQTPLGYSGYGDGMMQLMYAKNIIDTGWVTSSTRLGLNGQEFFYDFPICLLDNIGSLFLKIYLYLTANNVALSVNLTNLTFPFITAIVTYIVIRCFRVNSWISALSALLYTFLPYWFMRFCGHYWLAELQNAPLTLLLCYWIYTDSEFVRLRPVKKTFISVAVCLLIANSGIGYYQFFSCLFVFATGVIKSCSEKKLIFVGRGVALSALIGMLFAVNLIPAYLYNYNHGDNYKIVRRSPIEAEVYGTKISYLLLPQTESIPMSRIISERYSSYMELAPLKTENQTAFLGYIGAFGFCILILCLFNNSNSWCRELFMLSRLNIIAILFSTIGGFATLFAIFVSPSLRSTNRVCIYIGFMCISTVALCMQRWLKNGNSHKKEFFCMLLLITGLFVQIPHAPYIGYGESTLRWYKDKEFIAQIESAVPAGAAIWQMPYMPFPESVPINEMKEYAPMIGYIHSNNLRWSYGSIKGREWDSEYEKISNLSINEELDAIKDKGCAGIYIDIRGMKKDDYEAFKEKIVINFHTNPIYHPDKNIVFFPLKMDR